jgi:hypothetical protein
LGRWREYGVQSTGVYILQYNVVLTILFSSKPVVITACSLLFSHRFLHCFGDFGKCSGTVTVLVAA